MTTPVVGTVEPSKAKTWVSVVGSILTLIVPLVLSVQDYLPAPWPAVIGGVIIILTGLGVYRAPYKPADTTIVANSDIPAINAGTALVPDTTVTPTPYEAPPASGDLKRPWG